MAFDSNKMDKFSILEKIGEGGYGVVYKGKNKNTAQLVAINKIGSKSAEDGITRSAIRILRTLMEDIWTGVSRLPYSESFPDMFCTRYVLYDHVKNLDDSGMDLLKRMLLCDPQHRISAKDTREHSYFSAVNVPDSLASHPLYAELNTTFPQI